MLNKGHELLTFGRVNYLHTDEDAKSQYLGAVRSLDEIPWTDHVGNVPANHRTIKTLAIMQKVITLILKIK